MILKRLEVENYTTFSSASLNLATVADRPIVLLMGNNGAGKTSLLDAFHLVLHGRRSFVDSISEAEYSDTIRLKFHNKNFNRPCSIRLEFDFGENASIHHMYISRAWRSRGSHVVEELTVLMDGEQLAPQEADDVISSVVPPEVLRYFFFDGERIKELADWRRDDDQNLFAAVDDLLGLNIIDQLGRDLDRVSLQSQSVPDARELFEALEKLGLIEDELKNANERLKLCRANHRAASRQYEEVRRDFGLLGGLHAEEREAANTRINELRLKLETLEEELRTCRSCRCGDLVKRCSIKLRWRRGLKRHRPYLVF